MGRGRKRPCRLRLTFYPSHKKRLEQQARQSPSVLSRYHVASIERSRFSIEQLCSIRAEVTSVAFQKAANGKVERFLRNSDFRPR